eukprot:4081042-Pyramimonas_sp.AAC.1
MGAEAGTTTAAQRERRLSRAAAAAAQRGRSFRTVPRRLQTLEQSLSAEDGGDTHGQSTIGVPGFQTLGSLSNGSLSLALAALIVIHAT